nr:hypothetical protein [Variovorax sp. SCN 67-20]
MPTGTMRPSRPSTMKGRRAGSLPVVTMISPPSRRKVRAEASKRTSTALRVLSTSRVPSDSTTARRSPTPVR